MRKLKRRPKGTRQIYCHTCKTWMVFDFVTVLSMGIGPRHGEEIFLFKCPDCDNESHGVVFERLTPARK